MSDDSKRRGVTWPAAIGLLVLGLAIGYGVGREAMKAEIRQTFQDAFAPSAAGAAAPVEPVAAAAEPAPAGFDLEIKGIRAGYSDTGCTFSLELKSVPPRTRTARVYAIGADDQVLDSAVILDMRQGLQPGGLYEADFLRADCDAVQSLRVQ